MIAQRRRRRGVFLVELLVVISVTAILIFLCATLIQLFLRLQKTERTLLTERAALSRLARDLRRDAHAATHAETNESLVLDRPDGTRVEYRAREGALDRVERANGEVRRRESYRLPVRVVVAFEILKDELAPRIALTLARPLGERRGEERLEVRIEAEMARHRRLSKTGEVSHANPR
ncbi:MAG TPA: type II secretion system protein [Isosphaeraceae bacterium]|jgi:type II secretory pathway pseudopilin PulG|nr:type II secretion system protein [Isosphaeraceae bacterium]